MNLPDLFGGTRNVVLSVQAVFLIIDGSPEDSVKTEVNDENDMRLPCVLGFLYNPNL